MGKKQHHSKDVFVLATLIQSDLNSLSLFVQVCPSTRSTETSLCAPQICCPSPTSTQMLALLFRCPSRKTLTTCRLSLSRLHCCTPPAKVHAHAHLDKAVFVPYLFAEQRQTL